MASRNAKWLTVTTACLVCFAVGLNATAISTAVEEINGRFNIDDQDFPYSYFSITAWNTGAAIIPLFVLPLIEDFGLRKIYLPLYCVFTTFVVVQAVAPNFATFLVARVISGSSGGVLQNAVDGIAADIWRHEPELMSRSITVYIFSLLCGISFGPVFGAAVLKYLSWRWILCIQLIIYALLAPLVFVNIRETRNNAASASDSQDSHDPTMSKKISKTVWRSVQMLLTEFIVFTFTIWSSFAFGVVFISTQSVPQVFSNLYGWSEWQTGLVQGALVIGELFGFGLCLLQDRFYHSDQDPKILHTSHSKSPEARLYTSIPASLLGLTAGFFLYAWTSVSYNTWWAPAIGLCLIGMGIMAIVQAVSMYVTDAYLSHASSAISAVAFGENIFAAFLPMATQDMYGVLGFRWASSLLGFVSLMLSAVPIVLVLYGHKLRAASRLA